MDRYALFGHPVQHSRSPEIHRAFAEQTGEALHYELMDVPGDFEGAALAYFAAGGLGGNVTLPHKEAAFRFCDQVTGRAQRAGAVNTLVYEGDGVLGDNTDGAGLVRDLTHNIGIQLAGRSIVLLGASGAARGALGPLLAEGPAELFIANRTIEKAVALATECQDQRVRGGGYDDLPDSADIIVNATSASLQSELPPVPERFFENVTVAYDMAYADSPTVFLAYANAAGAGICRDGWGMLVEQAAEAFELWRGVRPETTALLK
ncbi:MAG: shikimate dehydrogenase [Gammaproteobacteria bacterium]|nr:shikimate dehydrogenase [Gammaproteobacteria bacterium]